MLQKILNTLKRLPLVAALLKTERWATMRYKFVLRTSKRVNANCTAFLRGPLQLEALLGPVLDMLLLENKDSKIKIIIAGCSIGSEAFTIASILKTRRPELSFDIHGFDIEANVIEMARERTFEARHIFNHLNMRDEFVKATFDIAKDRYRIKAEIARHIVFDIDDALDPTLNKRIGKADILFAQNFLYHLTPKESRVALENLCTLLKPKSALFVDGVDLDVRHSVTTALGLEPLDYKIEEIHNELRSIAVNASGDYSDTRGTAWPYQYWGLEPFSNMTNDWKRRYATVFIRDKTAYHFYY